MFKAALVVSVMNYTIFRVISELRHSYSELGNNIHPLYGLNVINCATYETLRNP